MSALKYGVVGAFVMLLCLGASVVASAQEMTTADRLAILYAPQFNFTRDGEPLIHVGVQKGTERVEISSSASVRVLPLGEGGPELFLPGKKTYKVQISDGRPGKYRYWAVVGRLPYGNEESLNKTMDLWVDRGYLPRPLEVGGLFAVGGRRFDSRDVLLGVGGTSQRNDAHQLAERIEARFGVETELHAELIEYPGGTLTFSGGGLPGEFSHKDILWISPTEAGQTFTVKAGEKSMHFAGSLILTADRRGKLNVVNLVPAETLLKGVVPSEVYTSAPMESLKAQAVAARCEIFSYLGARHLADPFKLCSEVHCQAYKGLDRENPRTNRAVDETRGMLMVEASSLKEEWRIVDARYSSSSGGHTENNENVWGDEPKPYLRGRFDARDLPAKFARGINDKNIADWIRSDHSAWSNTKEFGGSRNWRWTKAVDIKTVQSYLDKHFQIGRLKDIEILARGVSGRILKMRFVGDRSEVTLDRELSVRRAFGGLRSSMFIVQVERDARGYPRKFNFEGGGFGHGVGMCQTGAMIQGKHGRKFDEILKFYYQGVALKKVY